MLSHCALHPGARRPDARHPDARDPSDDEPTARMLREQLGTGANSHCDAHTEPRASPCKPSRLYLGAAVPYEPRVRIPAAAVLPLVLLVSSLPNVSAAQRRQLPRGPTAKTQSVRGQKILPLVEGNKWTYGFVQSGIPPRDDFAKLSPSQPATVVITVKSIEARGPDTVVTLEEKSTADLSKDPKKHILDERTITSTITCNRTKFEIRRRAGRLLRPDVRQVRSPQGHDLEAHQRRHRRGRVARGHRRALHAQGRRGLGRQAR